MYYRPQGYRYPRDMSIPPNYGGSMFSDVTENTEEDLRSQDVENTSSKIIEIPVESKEIAQREETAKDTEAKPASLLGNLRLNSLFNGRIGSEELLILALILLLSDSNGNDDLIILLVLLLFM